MLQQQQQAHGPPTPRTPRYLHYDQEEHAHRSPQGMGSTPQSRYPGAGEEVSPGGSQQGGLASVQASLAHMYLSPEQRASWAASRHQPAASPGASLSCEGAMLFRARVPC